MKYTLIFKKLSKSFWLFIVSMLIAISTDSICQEKGSEDNIVTGKKTRMYSEILGEWRPLEIYLPDDYEISEAPYPVLLVLDGGWFFNYCVSIVDMISPNYLPRMIVVGLPNTDRNRDLYPLHKDVCGTGKGSEKFLSFLREELFPALNKTYRTREYRILFGHSLAGLFTIYTLLKEPSMFNGYIATSPSLAVEKNMALLIGLLESVSPQILADKYLHFSGGGEESEELHQAIWEFDQSLKKHDVSGLQWSFDVFEGEGHIPIRGFYKGLRGLFHKWIPEFEFFRSGTLEDIKSHYGKLTKKYGFTVLPPTPIINVVGRRYLRENQSQIAIEVYTYFVSLYPNYAPGFLALAESYIQAKKTDLAIKNLHKCLKLDPSHTRAKELLEELR